VARAAGALCKRSDQVRQVDFARGRGMIVQVWRDGVIMSRYRRGVDISGTIAETVVLGDVYSSTGRELT
jgi:hypothetical protein